MSKENKESDFIRKYYKPKTEIGKDLKKIMIVIVEAKSGKRQ